MYLDTTKDFGWVGKTEDDPDFVKGEFGEEDDMEEDNLISRAPQ